MSHLELLEEFIRLYPGHVYGPVAPSFVAAAERHLGVALPLIYREFILRCGIAYATMGFYGVVPESHLNVLDKSLMLVSATLSVREYLVEPLRNRVSDMARERMPTRDPARLVAFSDDESGGSFFFFADGISPDPFVFYFDHDGPPVAWDPEWPTLSSHFQCFALCIERAQGRVDTTQIVKSRPPLGFFIDGPTLS